MADKKTAQKTAQKTADVIEWIAPIHPMDGQATTAADRNHQLDVHPLGIKETVTGGDGNVAIVRVYPLANLKCMGLAVPKAEAKKGAQPAVTK